MLWRFTGQKKRKEVRDHTTIQGSSDEGLNKGCDREDKKERYYRRKRKY